DPGEPRPRAIGEVSLRGYVVVVSLEAVEVDVLDKAADLGAAGRRLGGRLAAVLDPDVHRVGRRARGDAVAFVADGFDEQLQARRSHQVRWQASPKIAVAVGGQGDAIVGVCLRAAHVPKGSLYGGGVAYRDRQLDGIARLKDLWEAGENVQ